MLGLHLVFGTPFDTLIIWYPVYPFGTLVFHFVPCTSIWYHVPPIRTLELHLISCTSNLYICHDVAFVNNLLLYSLRRSRASEMSRFRFREVQFPETEKVILPRCTRIPFCRSGI